jgi:hypothetical protein
VIAVVGKNKKSLLKEFTGEDISSINRVIVDVGNPLARSTAGRVQMAEQLLQMNLIKNPEQYFQVMNTGSLESVYEGEMSENLLIKGENELMMGGTRVMSIFLDEHRQHIMEHRAVIADPELRQNPVLLQIVLDHIQEHINHLRNIDPDTLQLISQQPLNPPQMQGQPLSPELMGQSPQQQKGSFPSFFPQPNQMPPSQLPKVDSRLLPNPNLQDQAMGNVE